MNTLSRSRNSLMQLVALYLPGIILIISSCSDSSADKIAVTNNFYEIIKKYSLHGVPDDTSLVKLKPYISTRLQTHLRDAQNKEKHCQSVSKESIPPRFENCLFTSAFEGFSNIKDVLADTSRYNCMLITFSLDSPDPLLKPIIWTDRVCLQKEQGRWVIDDIEYLFNCQFCPSGRLRLVLESFISE
jgi:hypothetical protein